VGDNASRDRSRPHKRRPARTARAAKVATGRRQTGGVLAALGEPQVPLPGDRHDLGNGVGAPVRAPYKAEGYAAVQFDPGQDRQEANLQDVNGQGVGGGEGNGTHGGRPPVQGIAPARGDSVEGTEGPGDTPGQRRRRWVLVTAAEL